MAHEEETGRTPEDSGLQPHTEVVPVTDEVAGVLAASSDLAEMRERWDALARIARFSGVVRPKDETGLPADLIVGRFSDGDEARMSLPGPPVLQSSDLARWSLYGNPVQRVPSKSEGDELMGATAGDDPAGRSVGDVLRPPFVVPTVHSFVFDSASLRRLVGLVARDESDGTPQTPGDEDA